MSQMLFDQRNAGQGVAISIDNVHTSNFLSTIQTASIASGSFTPDLSKGGIIILTITANAAITLNTPINLPLPLFAGATSAGLEWTLMIQNSSGGTLTTGPAITGGAKYRVGTILNPGSTLAAVGQLMFDGTNHILIGAWNSSGV